MVAPLLEYTDPEEIQAIRNFIAVEILKRRLAIKDEFLEILKASKVFNPSMTISNLVAIMETPIENIVDIELPLTEIQAREIKEALNILDRDVKQKQSNIRIWNRILAVHPDIKDREKWLYRMLPSLDDKKYSQDTRLFQDVVVQDGHFTSFTTSPLMDGVEVKDICIYGPNDVNKIGKVGKTSWDSFTYAIMMGHNVWLHLNSVQEANFLVVVRHKEKTTKT